MDRRVSRILRNVGLGGLPGVGRVRIGSDRIVVDMNAFRVPISRTASLLQFCGIGARVESCRFDRIVIEDGAFGSGREMSGYVDCTFDGAKITHGGGDARFVRCSLP